MIPTTGRTHLDVVGDELALAASDALDIGLGDHAAATGRQTRPEHVRDLDHPLGRADRAVGVERSATLPGVAHQLGLGIAHLGRRCLAGAPRSDDTLSGQAIVDGSEHRGGGIGGQALLHRARVPNPTDSGEPAPLEPIRLGSAALFDAGCSAVSPWTRYTTAGVDGDRRPDDVVELGPGEVNGLDRRLLGDVADQRVLELGTGAGRSAIALARAGARVVAIDGDAGQVTRARGNAEEAGVHVELHHGDLAALAFLPADSFDAALSIHALAAVEDLGRVFRQVHRVLKADRPLVVTLPHPIELMVDAESRLLVESYGGSPLRGAGHHLTHDHTITAVFTLLTRSNFRVDTLLEPEGPKPHPASVVFRARKVGV